MDATVGRSPFQQHLKYNLPRWAFFRAFFLLGFPATGFADAKADVAALEARCEAEREAKLAPLREQEIAKCKADSNNTPDYCDRYWKDYGSARRGAMGGTIPRMFDDLPVCQEAFEARKALADGDLK